MEVRLLEQCLLLSKCSSVPGLSAQASLAETEEDGAPIRRLICLSQTQIKPAKPNTDCRGLLPQPSTPSQGTEHFQQAAPSQDCRAWGPLEGVSTEEVKEKEIRLFSSFPSKTSRARWAHLWANICLWSWPKVFWKCGCLFAFPLVFTCGSPQKPEG